LSIPVKKLDLINEYWRDQADLFSKLYYSWNPLLLANRLFLKHRLKIVLNLIDFNKTYRALDVGCGSGEFIQIVAPHYKEVIGIDYSLMMLNMAKKGWPSFRFRQWAVLLLSSHAVTGGMN